MNEIKPDDLWELLHEIAPYIPFSKPDLYHKVQDVLDGGIQGVSMGAAKEQLGELVKAGKRVVDRHDIGSLGAQGDSLAIEMLRGVVEKASDVLAESKGDNRK
jgi:hypothetical protein